ncbi:MAG: hypothetical protein PVI46_14265, partial [Lysobacterales bacterium]
MRTIFRFIALISVLLLLQGCGKEEKAAAPAAVTQAPPAAEPAPPPEPQPYVVELHAVGKKFEGPSEIPSGWTTFKFVNA